MTALFWTSAAVAVIATALVITRANAVHALLYLVVSFIGVAGALTSLGAPLAAALEIVVYAGAIVVLFVFVVMLLAQSPDAIARERELIRPSVWLGPSLLAAALLAELAAAVVTDSAPAVRIPSKEVGIVMYGPYLVGVEAASFLLLAGLVGAWHVGRGFRRETLSDREAA